MSLEEIREQNKRLVVETALEVFTRQGAGNTTVADISRACGLTERSIYRYYKTKVDLIQAAVYLYYDNMTREADRRGREMCRPGMTGLEQIHRMLRFYSHMYLSTPTRSASAPTRRSSSAGRAGSGTMCTGRRSSSSGRTARWCGPSARGWPTAACPPGWM